MARNTMQRKVKLSIVTYATISVEEGKVVQSEPKYLHVMGVATPLKAQREVKKLETEQFIIIDIEVEESIYSMSVAKFIELAEKEEITIQEDVK